MTILDEINLVLPAVLQAGGEIRKIYATEFSIQHKGKNDPLTEADLKSNDIIVSFLQKTFPMDAVLSEEIPDDKSRLSSNRLWVLDPLDGTREFVDKTDEFAITLGLAIGGEAVAGVILNPVRNELFVGITGTGFYAATVSTETVRLETADFKQQTIADTGTRPHFMVSNSEYKKGLFNDSFWQTETELTTTGSIAYKLALLAAGKCNMVVSLQYKNEWDVCGGTAIVRAAGGIVTSLQGETELQFNQPDTLIKGILAGSAGAVDTFRKTNRSHLVLK